MDIKLTDLILHVPNFLTQDQCDLLIEEFEKRKSEADLEHCNEATTNIDTYSSYHRVILQSGTPAFDLIQKSTETMIKRYMLYLDTFNSFHIGIRESMLYSHMYRLLKYEKGAKIHQHTDHDPYIYGSCTFNLNDNYEGGDFVFLKGGYRKKLGRGDAMIWPADFFWVHEVEEVTKGVRYSTNSFLQRIPNNLKNKVDEFVLKELSTENYEKPYNIPMQKVTRL